MSENDIILELRKVCKKYISKDLRKYFQFIEKEVTEASLWYSDYIHAKSRYLHFSGQSVKSGQVIIEINKALNTMITLIEELSITDMKAKNELRNILRNNHEVNRKIEVFSEKMNQLREDVLTLIKAEGKSKLTLSESESILKKHNIENLYKEYDLIFDTLSQYLYDKKNKNIYYNFVDLEDLFEYADDSIHDFLWVIRFHLYIKSNMSLYLINSNDLFDEAESIQNKIRLKYGRRSPFEFYGIIKAYF